MKLYPNQLPAHLETGNWKSGYLIFGEDQALVDQHRDRIVNSIAGPNAMQEMQLDKIEATDLSQQPGLLESLVRAQSFFGGKRVVCLEKASDQHNKLIFSQLDEWKEGFAHIIVTSSRLRPSSPLRKRFESDTDLAAIGIYTENLNQQDVSFLLKEANLTNVDADAMKLLVAVVEEQEPSTIKSLIEKLALYKYEDLAPLSEEEISACVPEFGEAGLDKLLEAVADRKLEEVGLLYRKLSKQDSEPVRVCLFSKRKFRNILTVASHASGPEAGLSKIKPPLFGPRRNNILRQSRLWGASGAEWALLELTKVDQIIRGSGTKPVEVIMERTLHRIAGYH